MGSGKREKDVIRGEAPFSALPRGLEQCPVPKEGAKLLGAIVPGNPSCQLSEPDAIAARQDQAPVVRGAGSRDVVPPWNSSNSRRPGPGAEGFRFHDDIQWSNPFIDEGQLFAGYIRRSRRHGPCRGSCFVGEEFLCLHDLRLTMTYGSTELYELLVFAHRATMFIRLQQLWKN